MKKYIIPFFLLLLLFSCNWDSTDTMMPRLSGKAGEVLVVTPQKYWDNEVGQEIRNILGALQQGLPQDESMFDVSHVTENKMGRLFKSFRSIVFIKIKSNTKEPKILTQSDLWAKGQLVIHIVAKDPNSCIEYIRENELKILSLLLDAERNRLKEVYKKNQDLKLSEFLAKENIKMIIPTGYEIVDKAENYTLMKKEYRDVVQGIAVYVYPNVDSTILNKEDLMRKRDSVLSKYPQWEVDEAYIQVESKYDDPVAYRYQLHGKYNATELRGLWRTAGGVLRGGPFVSITIIDEERNRAVTADGFVFAPSFIYKKRNLIREVYAVISTLELAE